ncbi:MAG: hypothetical protein ACPL06_00785 [Candidatus Anstonellales archaeon]
MKKTMFFMVLALVLLTHFAHSQQISSDDSSSQISNIEKITSEEEIQKMIDATTQLGKCEEPKGILDVFGLSYLALVVVIFFYTAAYLTGKLFNYPITDALLRIKIDEVATTVFIILAVTFLYSFVNSSGGYYYLNEAIKYNDKILGHVLRNIGIFTIFSTIIYLLYSLTIFIPIIPGMPLIKFTLSIGSAVKPIVDMIFQTSNILAVVVIEWTTMKAILCMIKTWWLSFVLPLGVLLRSLSITKDAGNTLIALGIGMYFLYPVLLTINYDIYEMQIGKAAVGGITNFDLFFGQVKNFFFGETGTKVLGVVIIGGLLLLYTRGAFAVVLVILWLVWLLQNTLLDTIFLIFIISMFLPALNVFITLTFIMELGKLLGTDINVSALTKII